MLLVIQWKWAISTLDSMCWMQVGIPSNQLEQFKLTALTDTVDFIFFLPSGSVTCAA